MGAENAALEWYEKHKDDLARLNHKEITTLAFMSGAIWQVGKDIDLYKPPDEAA